MYKEDEDKTQKKYVILRTLGKGSFGKVKEAIHVTSGEKIAIKILEKVKIKKDDDLVRIRREINILSKVQHPNIIQLYEVRAGSADHRDREVLLLRHGVRAERRALVLHREAKKAPTGLTQTVRTRSLQALPRAGVSRRVLAQDRLCAQRHKTFEHPHRRRLEPQANRLRLGQPVHRGGEVEDFLWLAVLRCTGGTAVLTR